jgi:SAM-dependent methyltransferase
VARVDDRHMQRFWDERAREDAFFFVDDRLEYRRPDVERFFLEGERTLDAILGELGVAIAGDEKVVEVGCGLGRITRAIAGRAGHVWALDVSPEMLERARNLNTELDNVEWLHGDGRSLRPVGDGCASACFSHVVFQHVPDPAITLDYVREMGRVLRPGGWAAFQVSNDPSIHRPRGGMEGFKRRFLSLVGLAPRGQRDPAWLGSAVDLDELRAAAADGGAQVENVLHEGTQFCLVLLRKG